MEDARVLARLMEHAWAVNDLLNDQPPEERERLRTMFLEVLDNDPVYEPRRSVASSDFDAKPLMQLAADLFRAEFDLPSPGLSGL